MVESVKDIGQFPRLKVDSISRVILPNQLPFSACKLVYTDDEESDNGQSCKCATLNKQTLQRS